VSRKHHQQANSGVKMINLWNDSVNSALMIQEIGFDVKLYHLDLRDLVAGASYRILAQQGKMDYY
jgi:hypothetical protein